MTKTEWFTFHWDKL